MINHVQALDHKQQVLKSHGWGWVQNTHVVIILNINMFLLLSRHDPDLTVTDSEETSILYLVCESHETKYFHKVTNHCRTFSQDIMDTPNKDGYTPLIVACKEGNAEAVKYVLDKGVRTGSSNVHSIYSHE